MISTLLTEVFFESLWLEIQAQFKEKLLVNVSYCSNKNVGEFFLEELTSEISGAYSITDNVILFGDYNIIFFNQREKELLTEFASNNALEIVNKNTPTWTNGNQETLIDHCLTTKHQIFDTTVIEQLFGSDHFTQVFFSSMDIDFENNKTQFFYRDTSKFTRANLNKKIASADWSFMYQQNNANSTFEKFSTMFENILNSIAPIKIGEPSSKSTKKKWLSRKILNLINEKHRLFNIWKITADVDAYTLYKRIKNHTNRLLRRASYNFSQKLFESLPDSKQQWKVVKTKKNTRTKTAKFLEFGSTKIS